jgi:hypothetical protein
VSNIVVVNASTVLTDAEVQAALVGLQSWDDLYLRPSWGLERCVYSFMSLVQLQAGGLAAVQGAWPIFLNRHSADPGALGWHTDDAGVTYGRVFVGDCLRYGVSWTVDLSHEAGETRVDPHIDNLFTMADGRMVLKEIGDAVEADENAIVIGNMKFTDFTMPDYFSYSATGRFDFQNKLKACCPALLPGGYMAVWDGAAWTQITTRYLGGPASWRSTRFDTSHRYRLLPVKP